MSLAGRFRRRPRLRPASRRRRARPLHGPANRLRPILAVRLDEGIGDDMDEVGVRRHVVLPRRKAAPCCGDGSPPNPSKRPPPARLDSGRLHIGRRSHVAGRGTLWCREWVEREQREARKRRHDANTRRPKGRGRQFGGRETTVEQETGWPAKVRSLVRRRSGAAWSVNRPYHSRGEGSRTGAAEQALALEADWCCNAYGAR